MNNTAAAAARLIRPGRTGGMLLSAGDKLTPAQLARLGRVLAVDDPTDEIGAAWACKELLRQLLNERDPDRIRHRLWRFYDAAARVEIPEVTRLATTIETWWPHIQVFLDLGVTNARTESFIIWSPPRGVFDVADGSGWAAWATRSLERVADVPHRAPVAG